MSLKRSPLRKLFLLAISCLLLTFILPRSLNSLSSYLRLSSAQHFPILRSPEIKISRLPNLLASSTSQLPSPKIHPLPQSLAQWQIQEDVGDYFYQVETNAVGYLVWSQFPINIYLEQPEYLDNSANSLRFQQWVTEVREAIKEWNNYLPLAEIEKAELADISIMRSQVDRDIKLDPETGLYKIPRAITAQTTYDFYLSSDPKPILRHRMKIQISPDLGENATLATARHELGHALGIWGHSDRKTDALYFSQVSDPPLISLRDINTLKKIYQQPTRLGWEIHN